MALVLFCLLFIRVWAEQTPVKLSHPISRGMQKITGITFLSGKLADSLIAKAIQKHVKGAVSVRLKPYSASDLLAGRAKRLTITGKNLLYDDFLPLASFSLTSNRELPLYLNGTKRPVLLQPVEFDLAFTLTEAGMNQALQSPQGQQKLSQLKVTLPPFGPQYLDVLSPSVVIQKDGQLFAKSLINIHNTPVENALPIEMLARIQPHDNRLALSDIHLRLEGVENTQGVEAFIEQYFGELVNLERLKIKRHQLNVMIEQCELVNKTLSVRSKITITPSQS